MSGACGPASAWSRSQSVEAALLFAFALCIHAGTASLVARGAGIPLGALAAFFDGPLYLEIAKSFPLPYAPEGPHYLGQAPGYPAAIALAKGVTPGLALHWGEVALWMSWVPAALAAVVFYALCRELGLPPLWPSVAFLLLNPRWLWVAASAHPEPLAMLFVLLGALAYRREQLAWSAVWFTLAGLTRFPALLLGVPLAYGTLLLRHQRGSGAFALLSLPLVGFGLLNLYLFQRIPEFQGVIAAHGVHLEAELTWPFVPLVENALLWPYPPGQGSFWALTFASLAFYLIAVGVGLFRRAPESRLLALWVAVVVGIHASLAGDWVARDFARLVILAWPAALLLLWRPLAAFAPLPALATACVAAGLLGGWVAVNLQTRAVAWQGISLPHPSHAIQTLESDEPQWRNYLLDRRRFLLRRARETQPNR